MKKNNLLKTVLLFVFAVLLLGCRQEADVLSQKNAQSNNNAIKMVSLSDIPQVTSFIKNKTGRKDLKIPFKNRNTHKLASISPIETIDLETNIIVEKVEDDIKYYVFNIDNIGDDKTIYNLEIKAVNGIVNDLMVVEYASTTSLAGDTNLKLLNFTGTVSTYNLDGTYRSSVNYIGGKGDCPNPEEPIYPSDPSNPTSPIDGSGSGSGGGLYDSGSPSDPSSGFDGGGSWWINYGGSSGNTRGNDGSNTSGDGAGGDGSSSGTPPSTGCNPNSYVFLQDVISNGEVVGKIYINDCGVKVFRSVLVSGGALRLSGDCGSGSGVILLDELDLKFEKYIRSFLAIDKYNYLNLPENEEFRDGLKQYYANNVGQPNLQTFLSWAVDFKNSNPNTSWTQFQNWFMGDSEGQDGEYDLASEIAFQQQQFQKHSLPSMTSYENAFPSNPNATYPNYYRDAAPNYEVYNNYVGGRLKQLFNQNGGNIIGNPYRNACAVRQSFTHNKLGIMIPFQHNDHKGDYNWNYILTASKMGVFLEGTYGPPTHKLIGTDANDLKKIGDFLKGKTGIYLVINNDPSKNTGAGYTGHTDMIKNGYVSGGANVTNSSGQIVRGGIKYIYIWELK